MEDLARLYVLALKHAPAGSIFNANTSNDSSARWVAMVSPVSDLMQSSNPVHVLLELLK